MRSLGVLFVAATAAAAGPVPAGAAPRTTTLGFPWEPHGTSVQRSPAVAAAMRAAYIEAAVRAGRSRPADGMARPAATSPQGETPPQPSITTAKWLRAGPIDVSKSPLSPILTVTYQAGPGFAEVSYALVSPSGTQTCAGDRTFPVGQLPGRVGVGDLVPYWCQAWGPWAEPGVWTLARVGISDANGETSYEGDAAGAFGAGGVMVLNTGGAIDLTPPSLSAATLTTRFIKLSADAPRVEVKYTASDNLSGVYRVYIAALSADGTNPLFLFSQSSGVLVDRGPAAIGLPPDTVPGVYTIQFAQVRDSAGNITEYSPEELLALFQGKVTFRIAR